MYDLYTEYCKTNDLPKVPIHTYRKFCNTDFNIGFHKLSKDECDLCGLYSNASGQFKVQMGVEYKDHIRNSKRAHESKLYDKTKALESLDVMLACFDLVKVPLTPNGKSSAFFFKKRLHTYDFTIHYLGTKEGDCLLWDETGGWGKCIACF